VSDNITTWNPADYAATALETLRENEQEILRDMERLEVRLEITRETIALLTGGHARQRKTPKPGRRAAQIAVGEPIPQFEPEPAAS
jgi:hypothetical protein